jgi:hypothetical protein
LLIGPNHSGAVIFASVASTSQCQEFYLREIQPKLRRLKVREIADALHLSRQYAAFIRAGRQRPHPRHWQNLAKHAAVVPVSS